MPTDPLRSLPKTTAAFVEPMDCLAVSKLPEGANWLWEIKLDGYRAVAVKSGGTVTLYSRSRKSLNGWFPYIIEPLRGLPEGTVVDGEIVALAENGLPVFNLLQNSNAVKSSHIGEWKAGRTARLFRWHGSADADCGTSFGHVVIT